MLTTAQIMNGIDFPISFTRTLQSCVGKKWMIPITFISTSSTKSHLSTYKRTGKVFPVWMGTVIKRKRNTISLIYKMVHRVNWREMDRTLMYQTPETHCCKRHAMSRDWRRKSRVAKNLSVNIIEYNISNDFAL